MKAKDMSNLYWFCQSVEYGGFAAASLQHKVSAPTLSRAVAQLEAQLGEKLLHRNAKLFQLTTSGNEYYQRFAPLFKQLDEQWLQLSNSQTSLTGDILVSCPEPFADYFLQQIAIEFMSTHPGVNIHIKFASDTERFFDDQIDLAVTTLPATASDLVQRKLFDSQLCLLASPNYLAKHGHPSSVEDLLQHNLLAGNTMKHWEFKQDGKTQQIPLNPKYSINSLRLTIQAACSGVGICLIPSTTASQFIEQGKLELLLSEAECQGGTTYIVWADRKLVPSRVTAFREMIFERMRQPLGFLAAISPQS
ncbi:MULTISPECIES: LysR family transcriptional regulator [unclassified Agarivorans]|uniref:LysR family transcriptional regulator n=1 Tax=unclassified Agarivorans TaxID=2636026 RepID=UPI0026E28B28|nr:MULTISPECIES: LysR family transcriptional regulator [unclassified Agarivorans]MDO6685202.1 LysR family transcriptional regulator [Agarivorans sp. 3_MG-2023]MDO6715626.1 LysR family transcriptional regulator [Agarivorans sp. 2_MG-2023]